MLRRIEIEPDDGFQFAGEFGIVADLEAVYAMGLEAVGLPYPSYRRVGNAHFASHRAPRPMRGMGWPALRSLLYHPRNDACPNRRLPSPPGSALQQPLQPQREKAPSPQGDGTRCDSHLRGNLVVLKPLGS